MSRRQFVAGSAAALSFLGNHPSLAASAEDAKAYPFDAQLVQRLAKELASKPYQLPDRSLPPGLQGIEYDAYRSIRFLPEHALWRQEGLPFQLQFFHRGWWFKDKIEIYIVNNGRADRVPYSPESFKFDLIAPVHDPDLGFAGFRIHAKINRPDYYDEVGVFLGASYFRAVAKGQVYGLSARGLSLRTGDPQGEQFPIFTTFWVEKPATNASSIVVHALLDGPSATGAFRFNIHPGEDTVYDTKMTLYPRSDLTEAGIGTGTSMFLFDANDRAGIDDYRPAVHDSDGLAVHSGSGEEIWRPLKNPRNLQVSIFNDVNPRGFGLMQRNRKFSSYEDLESHFEKRPSLWVEPVGNWGAGAVYLFEIPSKREIHDNIVAFWRPKEKLKAGGAYSFVYRLHWANARPNSPPLAVFARTRIGRARDGNRLFVLDITGKSLGAINLNEIKTALNASKGKISNLVLQRNPETEGLRLSFELDTTEEKLIELRGALTHGGKPISETWLYQWTPSALSNGVSLAAEQPEPIP